MEKAETSLAAGLKKTLPSENQINFLSNLKYLIVISKAYLKNYQLDDDRRYKRVEYFTPVSLFMDKNKYITELLDLSLGGAFISADSIPHIETGKQVSLSIPFVNQPSEMGDPMAICAV
ncbi:PilZ domain-containing protein [Thermodesulfobacteriota bacterium]